MVEASRIAQSIGIALDRYIKNNQDQFQYASGELSQLLRDIALASKVVNREINKAGLIDIMGPMGSQNSGGEEQQKLDVLANIRFTRALTKGGEACALISEEVPRKSFVHYRNLRVILHVPPIEVAPFPNGNAHRCEVTRRDGIHESLHVLSVLRLVSFHHGPVVPFIAMQERNRGQSH